MTLLGRSDECAQLEAVLTKARGGESGALVIRGDAGIGKSALLDFAAEQAAGMTVLQVMGTASEADLAFAGLHGLLRPVLDKLEQLPEPQARALAAAFGIGDAQSHDRFLVSAAALSLLALAAEERPLLCLIDDAQWLDQPSAEAIVFAARRLRADPVALLMTASEWEGRRFEAPGLAELTLDGLDSEAADRLLDDSAPGLAPAVRSRLLADARGNPLALRELASALSDEERSGRDPLPEQLSLTPRLRELFERRIRRLAAHEREALLVCALDGTADAGVVLRALAKLGLAAESLAGGEQAGLVRTTGEEHVDRRVWHQAVAALTGDEEVAAALEASAQRAAQRAGYASAASAFQRAAELTRDETRLVPRLAAAAQAAWHAGQVSRAQNLIERALQFAAGDERRRLLQLRASTELAQGRYRDGAATLLAAAGEDGDASTTLAILFDVVEPALQSGVPDEFGIESGAKAERLPTATPRDAFNRAVLLWRQKRLERKFDESSPFYEQAMQHAAELADDAEVQYQAGLLTEMTFGLGAALPHLSRAVELARRQGRIGLLPELLGQQSFGLSAASEFERAYATAGEGLQLALDTGQSPVWHLISLARVEAVWGDAEAARSHIDEALARGSDSFIVVAAAGGTLGLLELGAGRADAAVDVMLAASPGERLAIAWTLAIPDLVEAIVRAGHPAEAEADALLARLRRAAADSREFAALLARCEALLDRRPPEGAFADALALALTGALSPFERARTELLYGEWLRRERRRKEARPHLRAAADEFRRLAARRWQERAEAELRASGETARKREPSTIRELTPQELQIAQLAAEGFSNPEIAAQLYLSPRTIEYHLRKVFSKLGIRGRTDLIRNGIAAAAE